MRLSASWMSYPAVSLGDRFCMSQKGRTGGGGCMGAPEGCKQHGHVWAWSRKASRLEPGRPLRLL